ncbi:MAG: hypothetical protein ACI841_005040, partial [Planctomycetota bacterium]
RLARRPTAISMNGSGLEHRCVSPDVINTSS